MRAIEIPLHLSLANSLYTQTALNGGVSINADFQHPKSGYMVEMSSLGHFKSISEVNVHEVSAKIKYALEHEDLNKVYFGGWISPDKTVHFGVSENFEDLQDALYNAEGEYSVWDVVNNCDILVPKDSDCYDEDF